MLKKIENNNGVYSLEIEISGVDYNKAHYLCRKDLLKHIEIPRNKLRKIYVDERVNYGKE